jgi:hydroxymethylglutaryl-CoA reductase
MRNGEKTSFLPGFHKLSLPEKLRIIKEFAGLSKEDLVLIKKYQALPDFLDLENNLGPFKIATNFLINKKDYLVPMEIEEPSVVAAASRAAKLIREGGGFFGKCLGNEMVGQLQLIGIDGFQKVKRKILSQKEKILKIANQTNPFLFKIGGGAKDLKVKKRGNFLVLYLVCDPKDAMGANIINTMLEKISPFLEKITGKKSGAKIISNYVEKRMVMVEGKVPIEKLAQKNFSGKEVAQAVLNCQKLAELDVWRAVTHNKGVMNGIDALALATGNDFRAVESAVHSFASKSGKYKPVTKWEIENGFLKGKIKIPLPLATVGGATSTKKARLAFKILRVQDSQELRIVAASVGLANNLAALSVLGTEGIQKGHMKLHREFLKKIKND